MAVAVIVADDHAVVREGTRQILEREPDLEVVGEAATGIEAAELAERLVPAVLVCDLRLPGLSGIEVCARLRESRPEVRVLILSAFDDDEYVTAALRAGALGYLPKTAPGRRVVEAVRELAAGRTVLEPATASRLARQAMAPAITGTALSPREREVLQLLAHGRRNKEIARDMGISLRTVEGHLNGIFDKLGVGSRTEAVLYAISHRLVEADEP